MKVKNMPTSDQPIIFNVQQTGYYRVNYDLKNWELIANALMKDHTSIHVINRAQILDDAFELAKVGKLDYKTALKLTGYLEMETEYIPWYSAISGLSHLNKMLVRTSSYGDFKRYMLKLLSPIYRKVGYRPRPEDQHLDILLRKRVISWACAMGHEDCKAATKSNFNSWINMINPDAEGGNPIDVNLKTATYCSAIPQGGEEEWDFAWERYENSNVGGEKARILSALGCTDQVWLLNRYLNMSITEGSGVRKQDGSKVIGSVASNTVGRYLAFNFIRENWNTITEYLSGGFSSLRRTIKSVAKSFNTAFDISELKDFETKHSAELGTSKRALKQAIEAGKANVKWMEAYYETISAWLKEFNKNA